jgi:signal transduction histidine kinase
MPFLTRYGMDEGERTRRVNFLGITQADESNLRQLRTVFERCADEFVERFYAHLLADPHTGSFLRDPQRLARLKKLQADYFARLLEGNFDPAYYEGRLKVGVAHQKIDLAPVWYLGAYNQYIQITFPMFVEAFGESIGEVLPKLLSLVKVIFLDIGLALDTYFREATEQLRRRNEELQRALSLYWQTRGREEQLRKMASHEVRGGLAAVITGLEDLLDASRDKLGKSEAEQLESVTRRCWSLSRLLGEMLIQGQESPGPTWVDTAPIFESLRARFGLYTQGRTVHLVLPENPPRVWAEPLPLREVFANLVANAVNYLDKEPGRVTITCRPEGDFYLFCVADNGPGIPEAIRDRLFQPFVRGVEAQGQRPDGTGLGLYFVRTVIEQGGGRIWAESAPGEGSRFWFTVPRVQPTGKRG